MATQVYTFKITYAGSKDKIWRIFEVSSNYDLARFGYKTVVLKTQRRVDEFMKKI